ncbi:MAG TPA: hypothetical protein VL598_16005 [Trinickia sp.]|jgi:hypothetical protein|uniref:hypothetical protein n=1 Tax=Trinickia sp. TaxID=2571163 RepID=UPI002B7D1D93|nr:hypothetical protein [Trinickia sp.]HTI19154.1 hypothetical protein [Trinickia sp.]
MRSNQNQKPDTAFSIDTPDYFHIDDELIAFSTVKQAYFGIGGAARLVFEALVEKGASATAREIEQIIGTQHPLTREDVALIQEAIDSLVEIGVLLEQ